MRLGPYTAPSQRDAAHHMDCAARQVQGDRMVTMRGGVSHRIRWGVCRWAIQMLLRYFSYEKESAKCEFSSFLGDAQGVMTTPLVWLLRTARRLWRPA